MKNYFVVLVILTTMLIRPDAHSDDKTINFGATLSLTGSSAPFGQACQRGIDLAVEDINSSGGVQGRKLNVIIENFEVENLKSAASGAQKLINVDKVAVLFSNWSEDAEVISPIAESKGIVSMTLGAGGPGASRFAPSAFRATTSDSELAKAGVRAEREAGSKDACILIANTGYYLDIEKELTAEWKTSGGLVNFHEFLPYGTTDVRATVTKLRSASCDSIFIWASPNTLAALIGELRKQKVKARRVLPWFADTPEVLKLTEGDDQKYILHRWGFEDNKFITRYKKSFGHDFMRPAGNCYDGIRVMASVINEVGTDMEAVKAALLKLKDYKGVTGPFIITEERERTGEVAVSFNIRDSKLIPLR